MGENEGLPLDSPLRCFPPDPGKGNVGPTDLVAIFDAATAAEYRVMANEFDTAVPAGGAEGDVLSKYDAADYVFAWTTRHGYALQVMAAELAAPADAATMYFGGLSALPPQTTADLAPVYLPKGGTLKVAEVWWQAGTAGSNQDISVYVRLNNTSDTLIATLGNANAVKRFNNSALTITVAAGDRVEIKLVFPTWGTNPLNVRMGGMIYVE